VDLARAERAVLDEGLGAWLFYNLQHRDRISDLILGVPESVHNTRPWLYLLRSGAGAVKLVHAIEARILDHLPGEKRVYASRSGYLEALRGLAAHLGPTACQYSLELPVLSYLDHGTARLLSECGFDLRSSQNLIQRFLGVLDAEGIRSHEAAARHLYEIVAAVWERVREGFRRGGALRETTVQGWILEEFRRRGLATESSPVVAVGAHAADPHYEPQAGPPGTAPRDAVLEAGQVLLLDLWARQDRSGSVYADITWVGVLAASPGAEAARAFAAVAGARDAGLYYIADSLRKGEAPSGAEVDRQVRGVLERAGFGAFLKHRTGHAIDAQLHGYGVNLDSVEFPDARRIIEGSCFSIEPGVYLPEFGVRSEIDVFVRGGVPVVSGGEPQSELLVL
jgi:Xaa-Pro dipeptidase